MLDTEGRTIAKAGEAAMTEKLSGDGQVFKGQQFIADVHYELQIDSTYLVGTTPSGLGTSLISQDVQLRVEPARVVGVHFGAGPLTLRMRDGSNQMFFVSSPNGDCETAGALV